MATTYTFTCNTFQTSQPQADPTLPTCAGCPRSFTDTDLRKVENGAVDHLIEAHGYLDTPQLRIDILSCI